MWSHRVVEVIETMTADIDTPDLAELDAERADCIGLTQSRAEFFQVLFLQTEAILGVDVRYDAAREVAPGGRIQSHDPLSQPLMLRLTTRRRDRLERRTRSRWQTSWLASSATVHRSG